ncbi:hypothetical protein YC2023_060100 [Brassica napus]
MGIGSSGLRACDKRLSVLHTEMESLLWTVSCMRDKRISLICFETDWSDLVDITTNPMD